MSQAVGSLVRARGREWVVLPGSDDDLLLVRPLGGGDEEATGILLGLEGHDVAPARFPLPDPDQVGDFRASRLLREALRLGFRSSAGPFRSVGRIAVEPRAYQLVPLLMALKLDPVRLLIADDVGIGKTIEALLVARELIDHGDVQRMSVLCSPQLAEQWQRELVEKFHLDATLVLPSTVTRLERQLPLGTSLFEANPVTVVSTDYIKSDRRRHDFLRSAPDLIIVDEAHTSVHARGAGRGRHQRHELLSALAEDPARHLLLLTATPHSGKEDAFRELLALLEQRFAGLPGDLSGPANKSLREDLARHFVQRRRADIRRYLDEDTEFPDRQTTEATYTLNDAYRRLFERVLDFAREAVRDEADGRHRQRVRWWSALALLRSLASSPAAAAATLRNRANTADTATPGEADDVGRRTVLDQTEDGSGEATDVPPGSDWTDEGEKAGPRQRLLELAREAEKLEGKGDAKLGQAIRITKELLAEGHHPILFCRFIPTAEYVADALRSALPKGTVVEAVTGTLPPGEREARIDELMRHDGQRVLVATDCLSEGINLQRGLDAVVHYDLSWNPTRHEQREGRVDRFGQPADVVRTVTYYGTDNRIDGIVLDVLLRKHNAIRKSLGISVPVPADSNTVVEAIMEGLLLRGDSQQLTLEGIAQGERDGLLADWERAAGRERRSQTMFAQEAIKPDEVAGELSATRAAIGGEANVERFVADALPALGGVVSRRRDDAVALDASEVPPAARERMRFGEHTTLTARFSLPVAEGEAHLSRTHPLVEGLASHVLDTALDPHVDGIATRCGALRTTAVEVRTTLLLARFRFHLLVTEDGVERPLLAEDARVLAFTGAPEHANWLDPAEAEYLFAVQPNANVTPEQAAGFVRRVTDGWDALAPRLGEEADALAGELLSAHRRVRDAARRKGVRFHVRPHLPPDVLGIYVILPAGEVA